MGEITVAEKDSQLVVERLCSGLSFRWLWWFWFVAAKIPVRVS